MEQLLKLPQVRISTLEKLISSQTFRTHNQKALALNGGAIIEGQKPYYFKNRDHSKCQCVHMKCMCKFKLEEPEMDKYPYLKRKKKNQYDPNRCYTQPDQPTQDLFSTSQSKHFHQQFLSKNIAREPWEFKIWNKFSNAYSKVSLENKEKILQKYGNSMAELDLKKCLFEEFKLLSESNSLGNGGLLNNPNSLLSFMEQCFKNKKSLINKKMKNNHLMNHSNAFNTKSGKSLKSEKNAKKTKRANKQKGKQNEKVQFSNDKRDDARMSQMEKDVVLSQIQSEISELISKISNKEALRGSEDFMSSILNSCIDQFSLKLSQMQKMMGETEGNQQLKSMLYENLQNFLQHIRLTELVSQQKCLMLKQFCQMLKKQVEASEAIRNLHCQFRQKSMKCVKTVKRIKSIKSIKSLKRLNFECEQDEIDSQNETNNENRSRIQNSEYHYSIDSKSKIPSHFEMIEDDNVLNSKKNIKRSANQREGKMVRGSTKRTSFFKLNSKKSVNYESEVEADDDNLNNSKSFSLKKSLKFALETKEDEKEVNQAAFNFQKSRLDLSKKKIKKRVQLQHNIKEVLRREETMPSYLPSKQASPSITRKVSKIQEAIIEVKMQKESEEGNEEMSDEEVVLKKRTNNARFMKRVRALKQKNLEISKKIIEDFVRENEETVQTAKTYLKRQQLEEFIIGKTDSLLIKKKKLRNLKNIMSKESKPSVMKQILKYINLYETECELIMYRGVNEKIEKKQEGEEFTCKKLIEGYRLLDELKLISLSKEYVYGECDDHEMEQISNKKASKQAEVLNKKQPLKEEVSKKQKKKAHNIHLSQGDLIQVDVPEQGKYEKIPKQSFEKRKSIPEVIVVEKQNLYKKIKNLMSEKKKTKTKKDSKFLLTENLTFVEDSSRFSRTRHSLV